MTPHRLRDNIGAVGFYDTSGKLLFLCSYYWWWWCSCLRVVVAEGNTVMATVLSGLLPRRSERTSCLYTFHCSWLAIME